MEDMNIFQAIFLGIVQGVTEVLPISSSGHLVLIPWLWGFNDPGLSFDVALHMGTLIAIVAFFYNDWIRAVQGFFRAIKKKELKTAEERLPFFIVLATIPGVLAGYFLNDYAENLFRHPFLIAMTLMIFGYLLYQADKMKTSKKLEKLTAKSSLITGVSQAVAIIPGVSRSGATITAGLAQGFTRETAAKFSFLISAPIILGAGVFEIRNVPVTEMTTLVFWAGLLSAVISSFLTVKFLMKFVKSHSLKIFAYYRFALGFLIILLYNLGI